MERSLKHMSVILKSISLPPLRLFSDLILLAFSPKNRNFILHIVPAAVSAAAQSAASAAEVAQQIRYT